MKLILHAKRVYKYRELLRNLILRDIKTRGKQSFLGYLWIIINPFFSMVIYTLIVSVFLGVELTDIPYPVFVFCTLLPWSYFASTFNLITGSLVRHTSLITHIAFPREILLIASLIGPLFDLGISYVMLMFLMLVYRIPFHLTMLCIPGLLIIQMLLTFGLGSLFASLNVYYRDVSYFTGILLRAWMFLSPVVYPLDRVPEQYRFLYMLNPMAVLIDAYRSIVLKGQLPQAGYIIYSLLVAGVLLMIGYTLFKRLEPTFVDFI